MHVIPVINCTDIGCVSGRMTTMRHIADELGLSEYWMHVDIADGSFTNGYSTWRHVQDLNSLKQDARMRLEVHIMSNEPEFFVREWLEAGAKRVVMHLEGSVAVDAAAAMCEAHGSEFWLALAPGTPAEKVFPYIGITKGCQVLGVHPGLPRQQLLPEIYEKIALLRKNFPDLPIEVDGGVTLETAPLLARAGVTQLAAGTAIFDSEDPVAAFRALREVVY